MASTHEDFQRDLLDGEIAEIQVRNFVFLKWGIAMKHVGKKEPAFDLMLADMYDTGIGVDLDEYTAFVNTYGKTIEVKRDRKSDTSGNIYWEIWSNWPIRNPGCMQKCKADTFAIVRRDLTVKSLYTILFFNLPGLRAYILDNKNTFPVKSAWSNPDVRGYILPIDKLKNDLSEVHRGKSIFIGKEKFILENGIVKLSD